jgi:hypothetical protein
LAICYYYTKAGGFLGVLKTDVVQLAVVVIWLGFSIFLVLQMNSIDRIGIDIFHTTVDAKSEDDSGGYSFFHHPLLLVIGSCVYILTLLLNCLGIWTRSFGTLKKANERMYSAILSTFLLTILMMIPIGFGVCFNGLETGWEPFQLFFKVMKNLTGRSIFYSFLTTLAFTAIVITTIDSLLISSLQEVNRLNKKNDPSFRRQLLSQNSLMLSIIIVAGSISILLNYEYLFAILLIIYNINMLAFILIFHSLFQTETVSNWFKEKGMLFDRIFTLSKWDNHRSLFAFLVTVVLFAVPLAIFDRSRAWSMENFYILPFFVYFSFAFLNIIFKIERTKHG